MAMKLTSEQKAIDRELNRINSQIRQAYKQLGANSRLAKQYEILLTGYSETGRNIDKNAPMQQGGEKSMLRYNKEGIPQLSRTAAHIRMIQAGALANSIMQLGRMQTVAHAKKATIAAYEKRTGKKVKGAKNRQAAFEDELDRYQKMQTRFNAAKAEMYRIETARGVRFVNHNEIKKLSKGRWTSDENFNKMIKLAEETIADENAAVVSEFDALQGY